MPQLRQPPQQQAQAAGIQALKAEAAKNQQKAQGLMKPPDIGAMLTGLMSTPQG
jgi:hypothetical protein